MAAIITHDLTDIVRAVRAALLADPDLAAMLGTSNEIWRERPRTTITLPAIVILLGDEDHQIGDTHASAWRPEFLISVLSEGRDQGRRIHGYLNQSLVIPQQRRDPILSEWLRLDILYPFSSVIDFGEVVLQSTGQAVYETAVWWKGRVVVRRLPE